MPRTTSCHPESQPSTISTMPIAKLGPLLPDIWLTMVSFLDTPTLNSVSRTSSGMNEFLRPILYRDLHLHFDSEHEAATLNLLCSRKELALRVISLTLDASLHVFKSPGRYGHFIDTLGKMTSLKTILMPKSIFMNVQAEEIESFVSKLKYFNEHSNLTNVSSLTWDVRVPYFGGHGGVRAEVKAMNPVWKILESSSSSLRHLSFPSWLKHDWSKSYDHLRSIRAPFLRSFSIGPWCTEDSDTIKSFLLSHIDIEEVDFGHSLPLDRRKRNAGSPPFPSLNIGSQEIFLPNLRVFKGNLHALHRIMPHNVQCFQVPSRLETLDLTIGSWEMNFYDTPHPRIWLFLHSLKELIITLPTPHGLIDEEELGESKQCLEELINSSKDSLQRVSLKQSNDFDFSIIYQLSLLLGSAKQLTSVHISIPTATEEDIQEIASLFGVNCTNMLEEVWFSTKQMRGEKESDIKVTFMRNSWGGLSDVAIEGTMNESIRSELAMSIYLALA